MEQVRTSTLLTYCPHPWWMPLPILLTGQQPKHVALLLASKLSSVCAVLSSVISLSNSQSSSIPLNSFPSQPSLLSPESSITQQLRPQMQSATC